MVFVEVYLLHLINPSWSEFLDTVKFFLHQRRSHLFPSLHATWKSNVILRYFPGIVNWVCPMWKCVHTPGNTLLARVSGKGPHPVLWCHVHVLEVITGWLLKVSTKNCSLHEVNIAQAKITKDGLINPGLPCPYPGIILDWSYRANPGIQD